MYEIKGNDFSSLYYKDEQNPQVNTGLKKCNICNKKLPQNQFESLWTCNHLYCIQCLKYYAIYNLRNNYIIKCPKENCQQVVSKSMLQNSAYSNKRSLQSIIRYTSQKVCHICNELRDPQQFLNLCPCDHKYCKVCLEQYLKFQIENQFSFIRCPDQDCGKLVNMESIAYKSLPEMLKIRYQNKIQNIKLISNKSQRICPKCQKLTLSKMKNEQNLYCTSCLKKFCPKCLNLAHRKFAKCDNAVASILKYNLNFMRCQNCKFIVQKNQGCNHMTCPCGYQFCYLCGKYWQGFMHVCPPKPVFIRPKPVTKKIIPTRQIISLPKKNVQFNLSFSPYVLGSKQNFQTIKPNISYLFMSNRYKKQSKSKKTRASSSRNSSSFYSKLQLSGLI